MIQPTGVSRLRRWSSFLILLVVANSETFAVEADSESDRVLTDASASARTLSCGPLALYALGRMEGRDWNLGSLQTRLGLDQAGRHSLLDLREAGSSIGLRLIGVRFSREDWPLDRPALIHLETETEGHFVVIRPVGHSGTWIQVIDPTQGIDVHDVEDVFARQPTVNALMPIRFHEAAVIRFGLVILGLLAASSFLVFACSARRRRDRPRGDPLFAR